MKKIIFIMLALIASGVFAQSDAEKKKEPVQVITNVAVPDAFKLDIQTTTTPTNNPGGWSDTLMTVVITTAIAGFISLFTTLVVNYYAKKTQAGNNEHALAMLRVDNEAKTVEALTSRKFELRQGLYLRSVNAAMDMNKLFGEFLRQQDPTNIEAFLNFNKALTEIQLVGDTETVKAAYALQNENGKKFFELMAIRGQIEKARKGHPSTMEAVIESNINDQNMRMIREILPVRELMAVLQWNMKRELGVETDQQVLLTEVRKSWQMALNAMRDSAVTDS